MCEVRLNVRIMFSKKIEFCSSKMEERRKKKKLLGVPKTCMQSATNLHF